MEFVDHYGSDQYLTQELVSGVRLSQHFQAKRGRLRKIGVEFGTYNRRNRSGLLMTVTTLSGSLMYERRIDSSAIVNNSFAVFDVDIQLKKTGGYSINIIGNGRRGESVCCKWGPSRHSNSERLFVVDINTNNNELRCFLSYEEERQAQTVVEPPPRIVPSHVVEAMMASGEAVAKPASPVSSDPAVMEPEASERLDRGGSTSGRIPEPDAAERDDLDDNGDDRGGSRRKRRRRYSDETKVIGQVAVVVPVKNMSDVVGRALDSIFAQSYGNLDVVVVDDCSPGDEKRKIEKAVSGYNVKFHRTPQPRGASNARSVGEGMTRAEYILFCDADSELHPDCVAEMLCCLHDNPSADWVYCDYEIGDAKIETVEYDAGRLLSGWLCPVTSMIRHSKYRGFNCQLRRYQDWDMFLRMAENGSFGKRIAKTLFRTDAGRRLMTESTSLDDALADIIKSHPGVKPCLP